MPGKWQQLYLAGDGVPPLLFKYSIISSGGYELYLTDLNYIWSERLDTKAILRRADDDETIIDPSQDSEQFKVLLQKVGQGLQHEPGSTTSLKPSTRASKHALELTVTSELPAPLRPLKWKMYLLKEPQSSTTDYLLLPLIKAEADREACQRSLIEELHKKDWVLGKLFDKIEAMGLDLSTIFPGTTGLRGGRQGQTLAQAAKYIKGLAPFDERSWQEEVSKSFTDVGLAANIVAQMSGQLDSLKPPPDQWWESISVLEDKVSPVAGEEYSKPRPKATADAMDIDANNGSETEDDDEFERQETPPRLQKPKSALKEGKGQETRSDDDLEEEEPRSLKSGRVAGHASPAMRPKAISTGKSKTLGTIGGKKQKIQRSPSPQSLKTTPSPSPSPVRSPAPPQKHQTPPALEPDEHETTDDETDSSIGEEPRKHQPRPQPNDKAKDIITTTKPAARPSRGLGVIGGKKKHKQPTPEPEPEPEVESEPSNNKALQTLPQSHAQSATEPQHSQQAPPPTKKKRLGAIGGKAKAKSTNANDETPNFLQTGSVSPPTSKKQLQQEQDVLENEEAKSKKESPAPRTKKVVKEETPAEPERELTEEEKANRKREELKRQLAAKSKAPVKKKRRF